MVSANGTVINHNVPCPQSYCVPFLHFEALLAGAAVGAAGGVHIHRGTTGELLQDFIQWYTIGQN